MEIESILTESKWKILAELSHSPLSPKELAKKTNTTIANISTQVRLLEALGFVEKSSVAKAPSKARKLYTLKKEFCYIILGTRTVIGKRMLSNDLFFFKAMMINDKNAGSLMIKLFCANEEDFRDATFGYISLDDETFELLIISNEPEKFEHLNNEKLSWNKSSYNIKAHIHKAGDFEAGFYRRNEYFLSLIKKVLILQDNEFLTRLKKG